MTFASWKFNCNVSGADITKHVKRCINDVVPSPNAPEGRTNVATGEARSAQRTKRNPW